MTDENMPRTADAPPAHASTISIRGASEHNLRAVDLDLPRGSLIVLTGVSGSGKSSLAFDTIYVEGRRRYLETFSSYARQFLGRLSRPAVLELSGLSPAVAIDQATVIRSPRSTVGTLTELYDLLRLLWARAGIVPLDLGLPRVERSLFSFNSPEGACPRCQGLGVEDRLDPELLVAHPERTVREGALRITTPNGYLMYSQVTLDVLDQVCRAHGFTVDLPWNTLTDEQRGIILNGSDRIRIPYGKHPLASRLRWSGITAKPREEGTYKGILPVMEQILRRQRNDSILRFVRSMPCTECAGTRLRREALAVTHRGRTIADVAALSLDALRRFFEEEPSPALPSGAQKAHEAIARQVIARVQLLQHLGLGYLTLDRDSTTLSGGEAQRLRLARQAGIGLGGVLYVLDEPSVGLHHSDTGRLLDLLRLIRDRGNTVLVVEHDEQTMREADWLVDIGPAAGAAGGEVLYSGPPAALTAVAPAGARERSRTRAFLSGEERIALPPQRRGGSGSLVFQHLTRHNLQDVTIELRRGAFNVVTGVSGAGKSTLIEETVRRLPRGECFDRVIEIDQAPIGRTPRSNPATYTGLFDRVRDLFAAEPEARRRAFGKGRFSFNVKGGRCEACEGAGVEQIGMQFLGRVAVVCEACGGRRFNEDTLAVTHRGLNIHEVLELSIDAAARLFAGEPGIARHLDTLSALGLGYLTLGHPATMLSGGEAQRVKLASELARPGAGQTLFLLDEPTTGLHAADLQLLLSAIEQLVAQGNTVVAVEHHLDVIKTADWVIDLGPGSGADGGRVVAMGTPEAVAACESSLTGEALRPVLSGVRALCVTPAARDRGQRPPAPVRLTGVTTHNLQHLEVEIPAGRLTVITGVSGSGKSSLAFDTLFDEGQRRFAEGFTSYSRRFIPKTHGAELEEATGLTPTIAIRQHAPSRNPRSTVGTMSEIQDYYRLLFARAGARHCPSCGAALARGACGCGFRGVGMLTAAMFSPNSERGACPRCSGLGHLLECDASKLVSHPSRALADGALAGNRAASFYADPQGQHMAILAAAARARGIDFSLPWGSLDESARTLALLGAGDEQFEVSWDYVRGKRRGTHRFQSRWLGLLEYVRADYERKHADRRGDSLEPLMTPTPCPECRGGKLRPEALAVRFAGLGIAEVLALTVEESVRFLDDIEAGAAPKADQRALAISGELRAQLRRRLQRLCDAGLDYLTLDRPTASLSGGEVQRLRLTTQLGSGLTGIIYVLDEPTIGLHPRDTARLIGLLCSLRDAGNTVVVVEHDLEVIAAADHLIEIGPAAGTSGGRIVAQGAPELLVRDPASLTGRHLARIGSLRSRREAGPALTRRELRPGITLRGARAHNLQELEVHIPCGGLVAVTGVSGSGKSSLISDALYPSLKRALASSGAAPVGCRELVVHTRLGGVVRFDAAQLGGSGWGNAATHTGLFDPIRDLFARSDGARSRGLRPQAFSTQARGGRCEVCEGLGQTKIAMDFLPDVWVTCEACGGKRYRPEVLECLLEGRSIADVLDHSVADACALFRRLLPGSPLVSGLSVLERVGLAYLRLGQPTRTLSGGERQRLLLAGALLEPRPGPVLYLFDEPTTGLHPQDVAQLLTVFGELLEAGHSVLAIEHNLDVVRAADWVIDLGPEGGRAGGQLVAAGPPEAIALTAESHTGRALRNCVS